MALYLGDGIYICIYVCIYIYMCVCVCVHVCVYGVGILQRKPTGDLGLDPQKPTKLDVPGFTSPGCGTNH